MVDSTWTGIKSILVGLIGNVGVLIYTWLSYPDILDPKLSKSIKYFLLVQVTYGDLSNCIYLLAGIGVLFVVFGLLLIFDKKHFV